MYVLISDGDQDHADNSRDEGDVAKAVSLSPFTYFFLLYTTFYRSINAIFENSSNDDDDNAPVPPVTLKGTSVTDVPEADIDPEPLNDPFEIEPSRRLRSNITVPLKVSIGDPADTTSITA